MLPPFPLHKALNPGKCQLKGTGRSNATQTDTPLVPTPLCLPLSTGTHSHKEETADFKKNTKDPQQWLREATAAGLVASAATPSFEVCHVGQLTAGSQKQAKAFPLNFKDRWTRSEFQS